MAVDFPVVEHGANFVLVSLPDGHERNQAARRAEPLLIVGHQPVIGHPLAELLLKLALHVR